MNTEISGKNKQNFSEKISENQGILFQFNGGNPDGIIWSRVPKMNFVGRDIIKMGVHSAFIHYNYGCKDVLTVFEHFVLCEKFRLFANKLNEQKGDW